MVMLDSVSQSPVFKHWPCGFSDSFPYNLLGTIKTDTIILFVVVSGINDFKAARKIDHT